MTKTAKKPKEFAAGLLLFAVFAFIYAINSTGVSLLRSYQLDEVSLLRLY